MIDKLRKCQNIDEIVKEIKKFYESYDDNYYLPAIYQEGSYISKAFNSNSKENNNAEFYAKLIIRPNSKRITHSWMKNNLEGNFINPVDTIEDSDYIYNLVVQRKYYSNDLYVFNPSLVGDNPYIYEKNQDSKIIVNQIYFDSSFSTDEWPVLISDSDGEIKIFKKSFEDYVCSTYNSHSDFNLSVEFEYRDGAHAIIDTDNKSFEDYFIQNYSGNGVTDILGTVDISYVLPEIKKLDIITNQLNGSIRPINEHNWNDDMDAGLIAFDKKCLKYLKKRYLFIEYHMVDLFNQKSVLVDILDDKVVFWEGEFNQLPFEVKNDLEKYNIKTPSEKLMTPAMFDWQLNAMWDYDKSETPSMQLAKYIYENYLTAAYELGYSFDYPDSVNDFKNKINNILKIFDLNIEKISSEEAGYIELLKLMNDKEKYSLKKLKDLYDYFCYKLLLEVKHD